MKKSLVALAALAVVGVASAQSSVTIYGILDIGYNKTNAAGVKLGQNNATNGSFHTPSRFGLRGTEDLGGGLKANFNLESGDNDMSTGSSTVAFSRAAWAGLSGNFGAVRVGRISSVATQATASFDLNGISTTSPGHSLFGGAALNPVTWYGSSRRNAQFQYDTPDFSGLNAGLGLVAAGDNANKSTTQLRVNYANGPLAAAFVTESARTAANRTAYSLQGAYNFGVAKAVVGYGVSETVALGKGWNLGVNFPVGAANLGFQAARNTVTKITATELYANYALSKRTRLYLDYGHRSYSAGPDQNLYGFGILHSF